MKNTGPILSRAVAAVGAEPRYPEGRLCGRNGDFGGCEGEGGFTIAARRAASGVAAAVLACCLPHRASTETPKVWRQVDLGKQTPKTTETVACTVVNVVSVWTLAELKAGVGGPKRGYEKCEREHGQNTGAAVDLRFALPVPPALLSTALPAFVM
ncbi:hypothetical protein NDU88_006701 [Pleurodeles waltl]|uniref:Uncharacterized protein n=1 Tax=Pleurodeles waltl TaxID=8319 RepID=A0AAV7VQL9_PLEWA|nr:hypothetical protein NDU88_006701 [Pleurodeles waltl]